MPLNPKTILGTPVIKDIDGAYFNIRYELKINKPENYGNVILDRLLYIGFDIIRVSKRAMTLLLPKHWWASKVRGVIMFYDHVGRMRIVFGKEMDFVRRYSVQLMADPYKITGCDSFMGCIMDYTSVHRLLPFNKDFKLNAAIDAAGNKEKLALIYINACHNYMDKVFPAWQVETMYWDEPVSQVMAYEDE